MEKVEEKKPRSNTKLLWILSTIGLVVYVLFLILIKANTDSFPLSLFITFLVIGIVVFVGVLVGYKLFSGKKEVKEDLKNGLKPAITLKEASKIRSNMLADLEYMDYMTNPVEEVVELGRGIKSKVYICVGTGFYEKSKKYAIIINMHEPYTKASILVNPTDYVLELVKQRSASYPEELPQVKKSKVINPSGAIVETEEPVKEDKKEEKDDKKEDLK